ncbi:membrane hypothetical protein [Vibrio chagasii]|nr:membrane hypothetical protein [Vibrio chagasii]
MKIKFNIYSFILKLSFVAFFFYCFIGYLYSPNSPDIPMYRVDFENGNNSFEIGYNIYLGFFKNFISSDFNFFWLSIFIVEVVLIMMIYRNKYLFLYSLPSLIYSISMFSYQVRYSLFSLLFIYLIVYARRSIIVIFSLAFHKIGGAAYLLSISTKISHSRIPKLFYLGTYSLFILVFLVIISSYSQSFFFMFTELVGLDYFLLYVDKSDYLTSKSLVSMLIYFVLIFIILDGNKRISRNNDFLIAFTLSLLYGVVLFSSTAIISARLAKLLFLLIPFIIYKFSLRRTTHYHALLLFLVMFISMIYKIYKYGLFEVV